MVTASSPGQVGARLQLPTRVLTMALLAAFVVACGPTSGTTAGQGTTADLSYVKAQLDKYSAIPAFAPPGPAFDAKKLAGKTIFSIPQLSTIPFLATIEASMKSIAGQSNLKFVEYPTQGTQDQWIRGFQQAISQHADAIAIDAMNPAVVQPYIAQAKAAGIPVISEQYYDLSQLPQAIPALAASRPDNFALAGKLEADWVIWDTQGKANVLVEANKENLSTGALKPTHSRMSSLLHAAARLASSRTSTSRL